MISQENPSIWQDQLYDSLRRHGITLFSYVPDAGHAAVEQGITRALVTATEDFKGLGRSRKRPRP